MSGVKKEPMCARYIVCTLHCVHVTFRMVDNRYGRSEAGIWTLDGAKGLQDVIDRLTLDDAG